MSKFLIFIDLIIIIAAFILGILFLIKDYPNTAGFIIKSF